jgi:hypothetical protein
LPANRDQRLRSPSANHFSIVDRLEIASAGPPLPFALPDTS